MLPRGPHVHSSTMALGVPKSGRRTASIRWWQAAILSIVSFLIGRIASSSSFNCMSIINNTSATIAETTKDTNNGTCAVEGSFGPPNDIVIDFDKVKNMDLEPLNSVKNLTSEEYVNYMMKPPGKEHYRLQSYLSTTYGDCRHLTDVGTRYVTSALAMGSNLHTPVWTFDLVGSSERKRAFRGKTEEEWKEMADNIGVDIVFHNLDLLKVSDEDFRKYMGTWFIMLDTHHLPDSKPFERQFFQRLLDVQYRGMLGLDDIRLNVEMKKWWKELQDSGADEKGYKTYDLTKIGHGTGTGLVDFSGRVKIVAAEKTD